MVQIDLIQPRHNYAPPANEERFGHIYLPASLLTAASRLADAGVEVKLHDENISPRELSSQHVGIGLLGAPYIPEVMRMQREIREEVENPTYLLGGQVVSGLSPEQFHTLFGESAHNGNDDQELASVLGMKTKLKPQEETSLVPAYELIPDDVMRLYLQRESTLYVSQGCKYACDFCGGVTSFRDPTANKMVGVRETYRDPEIVRTELDYLVTRAKRLGLDSLSFYMSNLDVFQTPNELGQFTRAVQEVREGHPGFDITLRGLATVDSYLRARDQKDGPIPALVEAGFDTVGFGIDGMDPLVWKAIHKGFNTKEKCLEATRSAREDFGLTPEILMVFGHTNVDDETTVKNAFDFTVDVVRKYGAVPRPHVSKMFIPGNRRWTYPEYQDAIQTLLAHPESFQTLDFTALPSTLTHPEPELREATTQHYLQICSMPESTTLPVKPITPDLTPEEIEKVRQFNVGHYDR